MADEANLYNPLYYAQQFQQGQATLADTRAQAVERMRKNEQDSLTMNLAKQFADGQSAKGSTSIGPWQDASDPSVGGQLDQTPTPASPPPLALPGDDLRAQADMLSKRGKFFMDGGADASGRDQMKAAAEMREKAATIDKDAVTVNKDQLDTAVKGLEAVGQIYNSVVDQPSLDAANAQVAKLPGISPDSVAALPKVYSPRAVNAVLDHSMTRKDVLTLHQNQISNELKAREASNMDAYHQDNLALRQQAQDEKERADSIAKKSGALATIPTDTEIEQVRSKLISAEYGGNSPDTVDPDTGKTVAKDPSLDAGAASIAAEAKSLLVKSPDLTWDQAVTRAMVRSMGTGEWSDSRHGKLTDRGYPKFTPNVSNSTQGKTEQNAIPLPKDKSQWKKGAFYKLPNGKVAQWDGT